MDARELTELAAVVWATRHGHTPLAFERPDELNRRDQAVDLVGRDADGQARLVVEHTLVESFLNQRSTQIAATAMFMPLERQLSGQMPTPGHFHLTLEPSAVLGLKADVSRIRRWVTDWIRETAPSLELGSSKTAPAHFASVAVPDTDLEVTLRRWPHRDGEFALHFEAPPEEADVLTPSLEKAIKAKCPKLARAKEAYPGSASLLLLQIHDLALGNLFDLDVVVQAWLAPTTVDAPDHVWLVDTTDDPPSVMISKAGSAPGDDLTGRFLPFFLGAL